VQDLNLNPKLPFEDNSFDVITNVVCERFSYLSHYLSSFAVTSASSVCLAFQL
jgi:hypothetical protein